MFFKYPLSVAAAENIVVSVVHKMAVWACVKVIGIELNVLRRDLPILN